MFFFEKETEGPTNQQNSQPQFGRRTNPRTKERTNERTIARNNERDRRYWQTFLDGIWTFLFNAEWTNLTITFVTSVPVSFSIICLP